MGRVAPCQAPSSCGMRWRDLAPEVTLELPASVVMPALLCDLRCSAQVSPRGLTRDTAREMYQNISLKFAEQLRRCHRINVKMFTSAYFDKMENRIFTSTFLRQHFYLLTIHIQGCRYRYADEAVHKYRHTHIHLPSALSQ